MRSIPILVLTACFAFYLNPADAQPSAHVQLSPRERIGKKIYLSGESHSDSPIDAWLGNPPMKVSAKMLPCMNCHGLDGKGKPEGGVYPSNLNWSMLTKRYGLTHPSGRKHRAYDEETLKRAITRGIDPSGNKIGSSMPHFSMSQDDLSCLVAYLKRIEDDRDPGVDASHITIATMVPMDGPMGKLGNTVKDVLEALFEDINVSGGIYNRTIDLRVIPTGQTPGESIDQLKKTLETESIFALVAPYVPNAEDRLIELAAKREIPVIGSLGTSPDDPDGSNRFLFYLMSGMSIQAKALVDAYMEDLGPDGTPRAGLLSRAGKPYEIYAKSIKDQCRRRNIPLTVLSEYTSETFTPETLSEEVGKQDALFFIGPASECTRILKHTSEGGRTPRVYQLGSFLEREIFDCPEPFQGKLFATFQNVRSAQAPRDIQAYRDFLNRHNISAPPSTVLLSAYCAGRLLIESLTDAGGQPRREFLIRDLEGLYKHETGLIPPLTFGPNRRIGAYGADLVSIDLSAKSITSTNRWIKPKE
ncbi:MAG: ABC transporter substrate-binding protein [Phycisphaerae bacterium]